MSTPPFTPFSLHCFGCAVNTGPSAVARRTRCPRQCSSGFGGSPRPRPLRASAALPSPRSSQLSGTPSPPLAGTGARPHSHAPGVLAMLTLTSRPRPASRRSCQPNSPTSNLITPPGGSPIALRGRFRLPLPLACSSRKSVVGTSHAQGRTRGVFATSSPLCAM